MAATRQRPSAISSAGGKRVRKMRVAKKASAKQPARKRAVKATAKRKQPPIPLTKQAREARAAKMRASTEKRLATIARKKAELVVARESTMDQTLVRVTPGTPLVIDIGDQAAIDKAVMKAATVQLIQTDPPPATGAVLLDRVADAIERELVQIEVLVGRQRVTKTQRNDSERRARTLASLARTLNEVARLRGYDRTKPQDERAATVRDIAAFRLDLARRLDGLVAEAKARHPLAPE